MDKTLFSVTKLLSVLLLHASLFECLSSLAAYSACSCTILTVHRYPVQTDQVFSPADNLVSLGQFGLLPPAAVPCGSSLHDTMPIGRYLHSIILVVAITMMSMQGLEWGFSQDVYSI